jgi:hypothetical protein
MSRPWSERQWRPSSSAGWRRRRISSSWSPSGAPLVGATLATPHGDACFVRADPAATAEAWVDGHAFAFFGKVPPSVLCDSEEDQEVIRWINSPTNPLPGVEDPGRRDAGPGQALQRVPVA